MLNAGIYKKGPEVSFQPLLLVSASAEWFGCLEAHSAHAAHAAHVGHAAAALVV